jgi:Cutinase
MRARKALMIAAAGVVVAGGLAVAPFSFAAQAPGDGCADVEIIGARASTERAGLGVLIGPLAQRVTRGTARTVRSTAVEYPATLGNYQNSVRQGVADMAEKIEATVASCPDTKIVLAGYSQGAQVVGDTIAGAGRRGRPAVDAAAIDQVAAIALFGDPTFTAGEPFNAANRNRNGVFPRGRGKLDAVADRTRSFCNTGDTFCQGGQNLAAHLNYNGSLNAAEQFIVGKIGG